MRYGVLENASPVNLIVRQIADDSVVANVLGF